jgi:hypothetical protein
MTRRSAFAEHLRAFGWGWAALAAGIGAGAAGWGLGRLAADGFAVAGAILGYALASFLAVRWLVHGRGAFDPMILIRAVYWTLVAALSVAQVALLLAGTPLLSTVPFPAAGKVALALLGSLLVPLALLFPWFLAIGDRPP